MKKTVLIMALACLMTRGAEAQIYADDSWMRMPTADLFDMGMMNAMPEWRQKWQQGADRDKIHNWYQTIKKRQDYEKDFNDDDGHRFGHHG